MTIRPIRSYQLVIAAVALISVSAESASYVRHYFGPYVAQTRRGFESYGFPASLRTALEQRPALVIVSVLANQPYAHLAFYAPRVPNPGNIPITVDWPVAAPDTCILYFWSDQRIADEHRYRSRYFGGEDGGFTRVKCFQALGP